MESGACHVIYVHRDVGDSRTLRATAKDLALQNGIDPLLASPATASDLEPLLDAFGEVHVCSSGSTCMSKLFKLHDASMVDLRPTIVLIDTPHDERIPQPRARSQSPCSPRDEMEIQTPDEEVYGLRLLERIVSEANLHSLTKLVVPIPIISVKATKPAPTPATDDGAGDSTAQSAPDASSVAANRALIRRCLQLGAVDVIISPLTSKCVTTLEICAYRAHREAAKEQEILLEVRRGRKRSWVGVNEGKPYAYLREAMVSGLMKHICRSGDEEERVGNVRISVPSERRAEIKSAIGQWGFCAHDFSDDELIYAAKVMFRHALSMDELDRWRISTDQMINFLAACRSAYNVFVPFHNFRHVVDVLQATFHFLVRLGILPPYVDSSQPEEPIEEKSPMAALLKPFDALTLLITAIGHDVGHPGVNNGFLVTLNAPLAQLYNDRSVLESFHCAAYSQILRRYWPAAFEDAKMRSLMISSILATDMGLHFQYMNKLESVQSKLLESNSTDGWDGRQLETQKALACSLLIKCADISNVARKHETALQWMHVLSDEFSRQATMEQELQIPTALLSEPKKDVMSLSKAQLGFMNLFAIPLFQGVASIMPAMNYTVEELEMNKSLFEEKVQVEKAKLEPPQRRMMFLEGTLSPRTMSFAAESPAEEKVSEDSGMHTPSALVDPDQKDGKETCPPQASPVNRPTHLPSMPGEYKEVNGTPNSEDVRKFSDPFDSGEKLESYPDGKALPPGKQRHSETTDGSNSAPYSGEWGSQATSATTGKMPLSPSTQNTSIVSRDSIEQAPAVQSPFAEDLDHKAASESQTDSQTTIGEESNGTASKGDGKTLRKKSSRFRMNALQFFRRHKASSPPLPTNDTTG